MGIMKNPLRSWIAESPSTRDYHLIWYQIKTHGLKRVLSGNIYDHDFYEDHVELKIAYQELADLIYETAHPRSACDFGCGNAYLLYFLAQKGVEVSGFEASNAALQFIDSSIRDRIKIHDLTEQIAAGAYDLVISTEVAEHLPKKAAPTFVKSIAQSATKKIIFTAAKPGQWGDGHINCQPKTYWINLFESSGWKYDEAATTTFSNRVVQQPNIADKLPWIVDNFMLFSPGA
ncbi:MAG TPA: class I SAM-dependent methyltransferase [Pyrinomonadaceae bacterium]|nr:class I SAM-dependent methyltransferase [Pyrinomonadaceae bacterium]